MEQVRTQALEAGWVWKRGQLQLAQLRRVLLPGKRGVDDAVLRNLDRGRIGRDRDGGIDGDRLRQS